MDEMYQSASYIIAGDRTHGVERQVWSVPGHGLVEQFRVCVHHPAPGCPHATTTTIWETEREARAVFGFARSVFGDS